MGARRSPHREGRGPTSAPPVRYAPSPIELGVHSESLRNSVYFCALVGGLLAAVAVWLHGRDGPALPAASAWRVTSTAAQLVLTLAMLYVDLQCCPVAPDPARRGSGASAASRPAPRAPRKLSPPGRSSRGTASRGPRRPDRRRAPPRSSAKQTRRRARRGAASQRARCGEQAPAPTRVYGVDGRILSRHEREHQQTAVASEEYISRSPLHNASAA